MCDLVGTRHHHAFCRHFRQSPVRLLSSTVGLFGHTLKKSCFIVNRRFVNSRASLSCGAITKPKLVMSTPVYQSPFHGCSRLACTISLLSDVLGSCVCSHLYSSTDMPVASSCKIGHEDEPWSAADWAGTPSSGCAYRTEQFKSGAPGPTPGSIRRASEDRKSDGKADIPPPEVEEPWEWKSIPPPSCGCGYRGPAAPPPVSTPTELGDASVLPMAPSTSPPAPQHANSDGGMARRDDHMANNDGNGAITQCDDDVLSHIFHHLDARSLLRCASVCARWCEHVTSRQDTTWQRLCHRQWPWTWTKSTPTWKDEHRRRTLLDRAWASRDGKGQVFFTCVHIGFTRAFAPRRCDAVCWLNLVVT